MSARLRFLPAVLLAVLVAVCLLAPVLPLDNPLRMSMAQRFAAPSAAHWLGQDEMGRDILSRMIHGTRISLIIAFSAALLAGAIGTALGLAGGYLRGATELVTLRFMDVVLCFPPLLLAMMAVTLYGPGPLTLIPVLSIVFVPGFTRVAYACVLSLRSAEYVLASRAMGAGDLRIMLHGILPNVLGPILVQLSFVTAAAVVLESGLSFLGLGIVAPAPSLGLMIGSGRAALSTQPLLLVWPCVMLVGVILILNGVCDLLRDLLDPRRGRRPRLAAAPAPAAERQEAANA